MSAHGPFKALAQAEAKYRAQVMFQTWGHLEQRRGTQQPGWFVFSISDYGGMHVILGSDWGDLDDSPGLYNAMMDYVAKHGVRGQITRLTGHVTRLKNGRYRIGGTRHVIQQAPPKRHRTARC